MTGERTSEAGHIRVHRRQFVIARGGYRAAPDWMERPLACGLVLSHCPELRLASARDASDGEWILLGHAVAIGPGGPDPLAAVAGASREAVPELAHRWAGRWLLIGPHGVWPDASALLGCLWGRDDTGELVLTSSPALGAIVGCAVGRRVSDARRLQFEFGLSWFPPPLTRFEGLARLLPSQWLHLPTGTPAHRTLLPAVDLVADAETVIDQIVCDLAVVLAALPVLVNGPVWLGLTGGQDSRAILSIAARSRAPIRPFTRLTPRMSVADRVLPPRLAAKAGYRHETVRDAPRPVARAALLRDHAAGSVAEGDALPFLSGVRDSLSGVLIGGHGFAIATGHANWRGLPDTMPSPEAGAHLFLRHIGEPAEAAAAPGLAAWLDWAARTSAGSLDWRDRLYLEQRHAGWLAAKEQVFDMQNVVRFPLLNCATFTARFLSLPQHWRAGGGIQRSIIQRCLPALAEDPVNPPDRVFLTSHPLALLRRRGHRLARRIAQRLERMRAVRPGDRNP